MLCEPAGLSAHINNSGPPTFLAKDQHVQCRSVQQFVTALKGRSQELHILVNNAAVWCPADSKTVEGMEVRQSHAVVSN